VDLFDILTSHDERQTGVVCTENIVRNQIDKFERLLIPKDEFPNRVRLQRIGDRKRGGYRSRGEVAKRASRKSPRHS